MANNLPPPQPLNLNTSNLFSEYKQWIDSYILYELASGISEKDDKIRRATFLHCLGPNVQRIFFNLPDAKETYEQAKNALDKYFTPHKNVVSERFKFRQRKQNENEAIDAFVISLRELARSCEFGNLEDDMIRDQIIEKCYSHQLKEKYLQQENLNLMKAVEIARMHEKAKEEYKILTKEETFSSVNRVNANKNTKNYSNFNNKK